MNLDSQQRRQLNELFALNRRVMKTNLLKESLERLWTYRYEGAMLRELPVDRELRSPLRLPVFRLIPLSAHYPGSDRWSLFRSYCSIDFSLPRVSGGSAPASAISGPAQCLRYITACLTRRVA